ncbi:MAG: hypothetical protein QNJ17_08800 [Desulfocapsaceae bacterium]|nr:hypothetical protein [Desulfocapsaceae bacterium]
MRQQINLYQDILKDKTQPLQGRQAGVMLLLVFFCIALIAVFSYFQGSRLHKKAEVLRQQNEQAERQLAELERLYPPPVENALLAEKVRQLEAKLAGQKITLKYFEERDDNSNMKILRSLEKLAQNPFAGVWLRRIVISHDGKGVALTGSGVDAERLPDYLQMLSDSEVFAGQLFERLKIQRLQEKEDRVDFLLESLPEADQ